VTNLGSALNVLTAMITPALLLSACGTFILSTSNRLARVVDRIRWLAKHLDELSRPESEIALREERLGRARAEIRVQGERLKMIQRALTVLYTAAAAFVCTSVSIGIASTIETMWIYWLPVVFGIGGACSMLTAAVLLVREARKAVKDLSEEVGFHRQVARHYVEQMRTPDSESQS